ncbi:hypothetical protein D3C87_1319680 [compost metagenome]
MPWKVIIKNITNSRVNRYSPLFFIFFSFGCSTSTFKVSKQWKSATEIFVTPDRVILECEKLDRDDGVIASGFMMHVLDDKKRVLTIAQSNAIDPESCNDRLIAIGKILKTGNNLYIAAWGDFEGADVRTDYKYHFPKIGTFHGSKMSFQFAAITNDKGACFSAHHGPEKPCPRAPFPLKDN